MTAAEAARIMPKSRRGRKSKTPGLTLTPRQIREEINGLIRMANALSPYLIPRHPEWALQEDEIGALTEALALEVESFPQIMQWTNRIGRLTPHLILAQVAVGIVVRRLPQMKGIPVDFGSGEPGTNGAGVTPFPVGSGATPSDYRGYGDGQDVPRGPDSPDPTVRSEPKIESG